MTRSRGGDPYLLRLSSAWAASKFFGQAPGHRNREAESGSVSCPRTVLVRGPTGDRSSRSPRRSSNAADRVAGDATRGSGASGGTFGVQSDQMTDAAFPSTGVTAIEEAEAWQCRGACRQRGINRRNHAADADVGGAVHSACEHQPHRRRWRCAPRAGDQDFARHRHGGA